MKLSKEEKKMITCLRAKFEKANADLRNGHKVEVVVTAVISEHNRLGMIGEVPILKMKVYQSKGA